MLTLHDFASGLMPLVQLGNLVLIAVQLFLDSLVVAIVSLSQRLDASEHLYGDPVLLLHRRVLNRML